MRGLLLSITAFVLCSCGSGQTQEKATTEKEVVCFLYHRFGESRYPSTNTSVADFTAHLQYLKDNDFQVLTFSDAIDYLSSDDPEKKTAVITIDDGYSSFYENGLPVLKAFGFPATLFINTQTVGGGDYMDWSELQEAIDARVEIGNHTHSHGYFLNFPPDRRYRLFRAELAKSQRIIQKNLDVIPKTFAYPYGEYNLKMMEIVKEAGFKAAAAQKSGIIYSGTNLMLCPRFPMAEAYADPEKFASKAAMHALKISNVSKEDPLLPSGNSAPQLSLTIDTAALQLNQLQCFVQGHECNVQLDHNTVHVKATEAISNRRRTLYTITVPDKDGHWYWYSHLWINPEVKSEMQ